MGFSYVSIASSSTVGRATPVRFVVDTCQEVLNHAATLLSSVLQCCLDNICLDNYRSRAYSLVDQYSVPGDILRGACGRQRVGFLE